MRNFLCFISLGLPWKIRRALLEQQFGFQIHPSARIGVAWVLPARLVMEENTAIGHFTVIKNLELVHLKAHATIGRGNWITGFPLSQRASAGTAAIAGWQSQHFSSETDRRPELILGEHSAITHRHLIDCTNAIRIGAFTTIAGFQSQFISHTIDVKENRQTSRPITVGDYCFVGSNSVLLAGAALPNYCVLGAKSLLNKAYTQTHRLYGGVPARELSVLSPDCAYFNRREGFVV
jgi:acetyltransferase-like isoleucine patch superfamily enzyme